MTAAVISQQFLLDLLILSAQEERARERDTGLVRIRGKRDGERDIGRKRTVRKKRCCVQGVLSRSSQ